MSSSTDPRGTRRVLRDVDARTVPFAWELDAVSGVASRAVDLEAFAAARDAGYEAGHRAGYADGYESGRRVAADEAAAHELSRAAAVASAVEGLEQGVAAVRSESEATVRELEERLADAALRVATAIIGRELTVAVTPGRDVLARALHLVPGNDPMVVRMHPEDLATLDDQPQVPAGRALHLVADPQVGRGGCVIEVGDGRIDARIEAAIERVREVLAP